MRFGQPECEHGTPGGDPTTCALCRADASLVHMVSDDGRHTACGVSVYVATSFTTMRALVTCTACRGVLVPDVRKLAAGG